MRGFRIWDKQEKRMINEPVSEGIFLSGNGNLIDPDYPDIYLMDRYIRMDSTGLLDKQGKEIYEGDIVNWYINGAIRTGVVVYLPDGGMYNLKHLYDDLHVCNDWLRGEYKVIGNRYENPELMEVVNGN